MKQNASTDGRAVDGASSYRRPATALESVLREIRRALVSGELRPGERVMQDVLAEKLQVSRVPIREALHVLHGEGKLVHVPNHGYYAVSLSPRDLRELVQARALLEDAAITQGLSKISDDDIGRMKALVEGMEAAADRGEIDEMQRLNRVFHSALVIPSEMPHFLRIIDTLYDATSPYHRMYFADTRTYERIHREHYEIIEAARRKDGDQLLAIVHEHRTHAIEAAIVRLEFGRL